MADYIEFSEGPLSPFGVAILQLAEAEYETLDDAILDISQAIGQEEDVVEGLIRGDFLPEPEVVSVLSDLFDTTVEDDEIRDEFIETAIASWEMAGYGDEDDDDEDEDDWEDDDDFPTTEEALYDDDYDYDYDDDYADDAVEAAEYRAALAEQRVIEFERDQFLRQAHSQLRYDAEQMLAEGNLPPIFFHRLFGEDKEMGYANFSKSSELLNMDEEAHLSHIDYALNLFREVGPLMNFSQVVEDPILESITEDEDEAQEFLVRGMLASLRNG